MGSVIVLGADDREAKAQRKALEDTSVLFDFEFNSFADAGDSFNEAQFAEHVREGVDLIFVSVSWLEKVKNLRSDLPVLKNVPLVLTPGSVSQPVEMPANVVADLSRITQQSYFDQFSPIIEALSLIPRSAAGHITDIDLRREMIGLQKVRKENPYPPSLIERMKRVGLFDKDIG